MEDSISSENEDAYNPSAPAGTAPTVSYRVDPKDTDDSLSRKFYTTPTELRHLNQMSDFDEFTPGSFIKIPWRNPTTSTR